MQEHCVIRCLVSLVIKFHRPSFFRGLSAFKSVLPDTKIVVAAFL